MTIQITVKDPLPRDWEISMNHPELITLSPFAFFPVCGGSSLREHLAHGECFLGINGNNHNQFIARTDLINGYDNDSCNLVS